MLYYKPLCPGFGVELNAGVSKSSSMLISENKEHYFKFKPYTSSAWRVSDALFHPQFHCCPKLITCLASLLHCTATVKVTLGEWLNQGLDTCTGCTMKTRKIKGHFTYLVT